MRDGGWHRMLLVIGTDTEDTAEVLKLPRDVAVEAREALVAGAAQDALVLAAAAQGSREDVLRRAGGVRAVDAVVQSGHGRVPFEEPDGTWRACVRASAPV